MEKQLDIPVCATGNVHYLDENDAMFRKVLVRSQGGANPMNRHSLPAVHFRTTDEMLEEFAFLGEHIAEEIVIDNPRTIMERIGDVKPIKDDLYTPKIEGAEDEVKDIKLIRWHMNFTGKNYRKLLKNVWKKNLRQLLEMVLPLST